MAEWIVMMGFGVLVAFLGIVNMTGNISSLHWYHRKRVTEADRKPFGRLVGLGTLWVGLSIVVYGGVMMLYDITHMFWLVPLAVVLLVMGIRGGLGLTFYAMIRYNKGIF